MFEAKYEQIFVEEKLIKQIDLFWEYFVEEEEKLILSLYKKDREYMLYFEKQL